MSITEQWDTHLNIINANETHAIHDTLCLFVMMPSNYVHLETKRKKKYGILYENKTDKKKSSKCASRCDETCCITMQRIFCNCDSDMMILSLFIKFINRSVCSVF